MNYVFRRNPQSFELPWLNGSIPVSCGLSIDSEMKNRLADWLENLG